MAQKLRHALSESADRRLAGLVEVDETYYGGRGKPESRGRSLANPNKSLLALAVEKVPAGERQGDGLKASGFVAGAARLITDAFAGCAGLDDDYRHHPIVQDGGKNADTVLPIVHVLFSNFKSWLNGTFHGVSAKHLPRYARDWTYRFNRRGRIADLADFLLRLAVARPTITYRQLVKGAQPTGAAPALTG